MSKVVIVSAKHASYPGGRQFRPAVRYPETVFPEINNEPNDVYDAVREAFHLAGYDEAQYGMAAWNPLGHFVHPGDRVLMKPNLVQDWNGSGDTVECLYTQPSVIAAVLDYVVIALKGRGQVIIADAPMQSCNWDAIIRQSGLDGIVRYYQEKAPGIRFMLKDLRGITSVIRHGVLHYMDNPASRQTIVHLDDDSEFAGLPASQIKAMRITNYDPAILNSHHDAFHHEYAIASEALEADVIINLPKPKSHRKAGVTAALKNMVGVAARKEYLPHHTDGAYEDMHDGGDEYLHNSFLRRLSAGLTDKRNYYAQTLRSGKEAWVMTQVNRVVSRLARISKRDFAEGSWYGNHTISKTITDLNKILLYADQEGHMPQDSEMIKPARRYLIVADMIIAGEGEGPLMPTAKPLGLIGVGENPVTFDEVIATLWGAKMEFMHAILQARSTAGDKYPLAAANDIGRIVSNRPEWNGKTWKEIASDEKLYLKPTSGWKKAFYKC